MKVLLIYVREEEPAELYLLPNAVAHQYKNYLEDAHNNFVIIGNKPHNGMRGNKVIYSAVSNDETVDKKYLPYVGKLVKYKRSIGDGPIECIISKVYMTGCV